MFDRETVNGLTSPGRRQEHPAHGTATGAADEEIAMTEQEQPDPIGSEQQEDVEGHRRMTFAAGEPDSAADDDSDDDVEGHRFF
jgi:hypothetical protein